MSRIKSSFSQREKTREHYLNKRDIKSFINTYKENVKNYNTQKIWDSKFSDIDNLNDQDRMTKEKIRYIAECISMSYKTIKLLDVGIGQAYLEQELTNHNTKFTLFAIDISSLSIKRSKKNYNAIGFVDDALKMDKYFKSQSFQVIVAIEVIEHISPNKIFEFYKKVYNLLTNDGLFIISTPLNERLSNMNSNPNAHVREYTIPILRAEFELAKFKIIKTKTLIAFKNFYTLKKILSRIFPNHWEPNNIVIVAKKA